MTKQPNGLDLYKVATEEKIQKKYLDLTFIDEALLPVKQFPLECLPPLLRSYVEDVIERTQCCVEYVVIPLIIMLASIIGKGCHIKPKALDDWRVVCNLWGGVIGDPGTLKSPACNEALFPLNHLENKSAELYEKEYKVYEQKIKVFKAQQKAIEVDLKKAAQNRDQEAINALEEESKALCSKCPISPRHRRYKVGDITVEKLQALLSASPRGLLVVNDELAALWSSFNRKGHETSRSFYLQSWDGNTDCIVDRIIRGTVRSPETCLSIYGTTQPDKIEEALKKNTEALSNDGFFQRFQLFVMPEPHTWCFVDKPPKIEVRERLLQLCIFLSDVDFKTLGAKTDPILQGEQKEKAPYFNFSPQAQSVFNDWLQALENKRMDEPQGIIKEHLSKYRSLVPSLALILELLKGADARISNSNYKVDNVSLGSLNNAIKICDYLESHMRRIYGLVFREGVTQGKNQSDADVFFSWLLKKHRESNGQTVFSKRYLLRYASPKFRSLKVLLPLIKDLLVMSKIEEVKDAKEESYRLLVTEENDLSNQDKNLKNSQPNLVEVEI